MKIKYQNVYGATRGGHISDGFAYPKCPVCSKGHLLPVVLGGGGEKDVIYRCTNPECGYRFDKHGYERFDEKRQEFVRVKEF